MIPNGYDVFFDGIAGPTHNHSGLSEDNIASLRNRDKVSNPKAAALQGLEKMKLLSDLGVRQAVLPPHERPHLPTLRALGFRGMDRALPEKAYETMPEILPCISSASAMYAANAASITPSIDSSDAKVHITPSNMNRTKHRSIEPEFTAKILKILFNSTVYFTHHSPLPFGDIFSDEGCANQCHFSQKNNRTGIHLFVYGNSARHPIVEGERISIRQTLEAGEALARSHHIPPERVIFARQSGASLEAGVFHNDLISVGARNLFFVHELAFSDTSSVISEITDKMQEHCDIPAHIIEVPNDIISLRTAVKTYLFNSQLVEVEEGVFTLIAPMECQTNAAIFQYLDKLTKDPEHPVRDIHYINLQESMRNGGGPACLSLRASLTQNEINAIHPNVFLTERLYNRLMDWIERHYRDRLEPKDLVDPLLVDETQHALDELTRILDLGNIYSFQA
ncbi:MAG: N-succinylarginine dihydrolase [Waddliaceae bacterium]